MKVEPLSNKAGFLSIYPDVMCVPGAVYAFLALVSSQQHPRHMARDYEREARLYAVRCDLTGFKHYFQLSHRYSPQKFAPIAEL